MLTTSQFGVRAPLSPLAQAALEKHLPELSAKRKFGKQNIKAMQKVDVGCITDIYCCEELPEIEIISLIEEKLPKYKIRADFLTEFSGYANQDWYIPAPALPIPPEGLELTKDQIRETLNYFLLCGNRISQMTRAYDDIEAVTRLLEEKEKDLELTVQIGKELLVQNNRLESRISELEHELKSSNEDRAQLVHDLHKKNELISVLTNDADDSSDLDTPTFSKSITLDLLQKKISSLQDENKSLKIEASQIVKQTDEIEEQERKLMEDITFQLNSAHSSYDGLNLELERQKEENRIQHEQIISLTARLAETEMRLHQLTAENDEQVSLLSITKENQNLLASELADFKQRYQEILALLQEAQEYMRKNRKKQQPHARSSLFSNFCGIPHPDSLHLELMESSTHSENSLDSGISVERRLSNLEVNSHLNLNDNNGQNRTISASKKIFETVQCATKNASYSDCVSHLGTMSLSSSSFTRMSALPFNGYNSNPAGSYHRPSSVYSGFTYPSNDSSSMGGKTMSCDSLNSQSDDGFPQHPSGVPGAPGAKDLEAAIKRLTPAEVLARRAMLSHAPLGTYNYDEQSTKISGFTFGIRTPESIMSAGSSRLSNISDSIIYEGSKMESYHNPNNNQWRLPEKLQIVKPIEGSQTLGHWSRLATPTLSGLLEERPGVTIRGGRGLDDLGLQIYSLSDVEEDVDELPGKQFQNSGYTNTYTVSHVLHPDDGLVNDLSFLSQSQLSSRMASTSTSRQPSCSETPRTGLSRKNSCSTYSVNMGLASMLNERGIKAVTPSALNTPAGPNYSPTVTPCNSPEGSPTRSTSPEPLFGIFSSGADLIRRKLIGEQQQPKNPIHNKKQKIMLSRLEKRALQSLRLLEKVESVGLENIIATQPSAMSQLASGIANRSISPMAQLTSLKNFQAANNGMVDDLQFDRTQIRALLNKGLLNEISNLKTIEDNICGGTMDDDKHETYAQNENIIEVTTLRSKENAANSVKLSSLTSEKNPREIEASKVQGSYLSDSSYPIDTRLKQIQRQKSRRNIKNGQRPDLGTVSGRIRSDLGKVEQRTSNTETTQYITQVSREEKINNSSVKSVSNTIEMQTSTQQSITQSFVGSISSLFFGRKGGWL